MVLNIYRQNMKNHFACNTTLMRISVLAFLLCLTVATNSFHQNTQLGKANQPFVHEKLVLHFGIGETLPPPITVVPGTTPTESSSLSTSQTTRVTVTSTSMEPTTTPNPTSTASPTPEANHMKIIVITLFITFISLLCITYLLVKFRTKIYHLILAVSYWMLRHQERTDETVVMETLNEVISSMTPAERQRLRQIHTDYQSTSFHQEPPIDLQTWRNNNMDVSFEYGPDVYFWDMYDYNTINDQQEQHERNHSGCAYENLGFQNDELPSTKELSSHRSHIDSGTLDFVQRW